MNLLLQRLKSKTYLLAVLTALLGVIQAYPQLIFDTFRLTAVQQGWLMILVGIAAAIVREYTTKPLDQK